MVLALEKRKNFIARWTSKETGGKAQIFPQSRVMTKEFGEFQTWKRLANLESVHGGYLCCWKLIFPLKDFTSFRALVVATSLSSEICRLRISGPRVMLRHRLHLAHVQCCHSLSPGQTLSWAHFQSHLRPDSCVYVPYYLQFSLNMWLSETNTLLQGSQVALVVGEPICQGRRYKRPQFNLWVGEDCLEEVMATHLCILPGTPWTQA